MTDDDEAAREEMIRAGAFGDVRHLTGRFRCTREKHDDDHHAYDAIADREWRKHAAVTMERLRCPVWIRGESKTK